MAKDPITGQDIPDDSAASLSAPEIEALAKVFDRLPFLNSPEDQETVQLLQNNLRKFLKSKRQRH